MITEIMTSFLRMPLTYLLCGTHLSSFGNIHYMRHMTNMGQSTGTHTHMRRKIYSMGQ